MTVAAVAASLLPSWTPTLTFNQLHVIVRKPPSSHVRASSPSFGDRLSSNAALVCVPLAQQMPK